jgi:hypothetical protein
MRQYRLGHSLSPQAVTEVVRLRSRRQSGTNAACVGTVFAAASTEPETQNQSRKRQDDTGEGCAHDALILRLRTTRNQHLSILVKERSFQCDGYGGRACLERRSPDTNRHH